MPETQRNYQTLLDMEEQCALVSWKKFCVWEAGRTNGAHYPIIKKLEKHGQIEVTSTAECDYLLVFCPVVSRVGTDIGEALDNIPPGKPVILVVMHHTFNPNHVVSESWKQVNNPNVRLTVDCLFYEEKLLDCQLNDIMWSKIRGIFGDPIPQVPCKPKWMSRKVWIAVAAAVLIIVLIIIITQVV